LARAMTGDFSNSLRFNQPALPLVFERMPATIQLAAVALGLAVVIGPILGWVAATRRGTLFELLAMLLALVGQAIPVFWLGIMLILLFAVQWQLLPSGGYGGPQNLILPAFAL